MFGLELNGIGGGPSLVGGFLGLELKPHCNALLGWALDGGGGRRRAGRAGDGASDWLTAGDFAGLDGSRGGSEGRAAGEGSVVRLGRTGGSATCLDGRDGAEFCACCCAASFALASSSRRVGGKGGSFACSRVGGNFLTPLTSEDLVRPRDRDDTVD